MGVLPIISRLALSVIFAIETTDFGAGVNILTMKYTSDKIILKIPKIDSTSSNLLHSFIRVFYLRSRLGGCGIGHGVGAKALRPTLLLHSAVAAMHQGELKTSHN